LTLVHGGGFNAPEEGGRLAAPIMCAPASTERRTVAGDDGCGAALRHGIHNFGIKELMPHCEETDQVFPHQYSFKDGLMTRAMRGAGCGA